MSWEGPLPNHTPSAIANAFADLAGCAMPQMKLQKLTYLANGWNLAIAGMPLVDAQPEAWDNGPVFRSIWNRLRDLGSASGKVRDYDGSVPKAALTDDERAVIQHVWQKYGQKNARELSDLTHQPNTPWSRAYYDRGRNAVISNEEIRDHYLALARAGRVSAQA
jgi:uncharacterized phage-associated protein